MRSLITVINAAVEFLFLHRIRRIYKAKLRKLKYERANLFIHRDLLKGEEYCRYWSRFGFKVSRDWFDFYHNLSGKGCIRYVPSDVYYVKIERILNDPNVAYAWANKNLLGNNFGGEYFPETLFHFMSKDLYDSDYNEISLEAANEIIKLSGEDAVLKIAEESCGGHGVEFYQWKGGQLLSKEKPLSLNKLVKKGRPFILQKSISQGEFTASFNSSSVNTFRVVTCRLPKSGKVVVLKRILRIGVGNSKVDNQSSGGISVGIFNDGNLNEKAFDGKGNSYVQHPTTKINFKGQCFDAVRELDQFAIRLAAGVPGLRILSLDIVQCVDNTFKCLEVNTYGMQIDFLQTFDGGMFGPFTDEIIDYCLREQDRYSYIHVRGFYF
jgi:hypothetical protein